MYKNLLKLVAYTIDPSELEILWYENDKGDRYFLSEEEWKNAGELEVPEGYKYQVSRFPDEVTTTYLEILDDGTSKEVMQGHSGYSEDLVLAIANSGKYTLGESIIIASESCERCMNSIAHDYGLDWGYKEGSEEWAKTNTQCMFCNPNLREEIREENKLEMEEINKS